LVSRLRQLLSHSLELAFRVAEMEEGWDAELYRVVLPGDQETIGRVE